MNQVQTRPAKRIEDKQNSETLLDAIGAYLANPSKKKLNNKQAEKLNRLYHCDDLIRQYGGRNRVLPQLMKRYDYSRASAHQDFLDTQQVFNTQSVHNRDYWIDLIIGEVKKTKELAMINKDPKAAAMADKNMIHIAERLLGDKEVIPQENIKPSNILIGFFPETTKVKQLSDKEIEAAVKRLSKSKRKKNLMIEDVEAIA